MMSLLLYPESHGVTPHSEIQVVTLVAESFSILGLSEAFFSISDYLGCVV